MHKTFSVKIESLGNNIFSSQGSNLFILFSPLANITKFVMPSSSLSDLSFLEKHISIYNGDSIT